MDNFTQYANNKKKIAELEKECDALKDELLGSLRSVELPMKYAGGRFTIVKRKTIQYTSVITDAENNFKEEMAVLKEHEVETGKAKVTESESLSFTADKENGKQEASN